MIAWRARTFWLGIVLLACREPAVPAAAVSHLPPAESDIRQAALAAVLSAPWETDPSGWGALCSLQVPCDTLVIEPRIVSLAAQAPAFFVPDRRELAATLTPDAVSQVRIPGHQLVLGSYQQCGTRREAKTWARGRAACVALGVMGLSDARPDAMTFALLVLTPAKGLSWPRMRATRPRQNWSGRLISNASE